MNVNRTALPFLVFLAAAVPAYAQQDLTEEEAKREKRFQEEAAKNPDTTKAPGWHNSLVVGLNLTQVTLKDWAPGGENALSYSSSLIGKTEHIGERTVWSNYLKLAFGQTKLEDEQIRKTDDEIYFESLLIYHIWSKINPYASATLRTQFAPGYSYNDDGSRTEISTFFDPAYLTQSAGFAYQPSSIITSRLGIGVREVLTSQFNAYADDAATSEIEKTRIQGGLESVTQLDWTFEENMTLSSRLELFAPFEEMDRIIVRNDNIITAKVTKVIAVTFNLQLVNDVNVTPRTQWKESLALGVTYAIL
jgi:hypothetical protein